MPAGSRQPTGRRSPPMPRTRSWSTGLPATTAMGVAAPAWARRKDSRTARRSAQGMALVIMGYRKGEAAKAAGDRDRDRDPGAVVHRIPARPVLDRRLTPRRAGEGIDDVRRGLVE